MEEPLQEALRAAQLGETAGDIPFDGQEAARVAIHALCRQARDRVWIASPRLDPRLFGAPELETALSAFLRAHRRSEVRVLVQDALALAREEHRLLRLAQRLSSHMEIRRQHEDFSEFLETWILVDKTGLLRLPHADRTLGTVCFDAAQAVRERADAYEAMWATALPDPNLRRLHL